jgi:hypothetical protein
MLADAAFYNSAASAGHKIFKSNSFAAAKE